MAAGGGFRPFSYSTRIFVVLLSSRKVLVQNAASLLAEKTGHSRNQLSERRRSHSGT